MGEDYLTGSTESDNEGLYENVKVYPLSPHPHVVFGRKKGRHKNQGGGV